MILRSCFHQNQRFALTTIVNAHFWAFWNDVYSKISMDATAFCSNHVWKRWFWPQKLSMNAPRFESAFWNAVYSISAFWNAVYSKISMDATAFCSNHVWKHWFWPQKLSINAPFNSQRYLDCDCINFKTVFIPGCLSIHLNISNYYTVRPRKKETHKSSWFFRKL